jgi:hypothetical protein
MVDADAFNGTYAKNPFNFKNYNITTMGLTVNGESLPGKPLQLRFDGGRDYISALQTLYAGTHKMFENQGNGIDRAEYASGYTLFVFDLTPDLCFGDHAQPIRNGNVSIECQFGGALENAINILVLGEFQSLIEIDANRNVLCDFNSRTQISYVIFYSKMLLQRRCLRTFYRRIAYLRKYENQRDLFSIRIPAINRERIGWLCFWLPMENESFGIPMAKHLDFTVRPLLDF